MIYKVTYALASISQHVRNEISCALADATRNATLRRDARRSWEAYRPSHDKTADFIGSEDGVIYRVIG